MGNTFTYAGIIVACCLMAFKWVLKEGRPGGLSFLAYKGPCHARPRQFASSRSARNVQHLKCQMTDSFVFGLVLPRVHAMTCYLCIMGGYSPRRHRGSVIHWQSKTDPTDPVATIHSMFQCEICVHSLSKYISYYSSYSMSQSTSIETLSCIKVLAGGS
jgi:hypothetical protein